MEKEINAGLKKRLLEIQKSENHAGFLSDFLESNNILAISIEYVFRQEINAVKHIDIIGMEFTAKEILDKFKDAREELFDEFKNNMYFRKEFVQIDDMFFDREKIIDFIYNCQ